MALVCFLRAFFEVCMRCRSGELIQARLLEPDPRAVAKSWAACGVSWACPGPPGPRRREPPGCFVIISRAKLLATSDVFMQLLPRKGILAITAVIDIALHARSGPVAAKALATRHRLPPRHLEPVLQALVRHGILKGTRGPRGGYELAREWSRITADEILRAAGTVDDIESKPNERSKLLDQVVMPALSVAEQAFAAALSRINIEELARSAEGARKSGSVGNQG
jgi:Rrf2 family protein